MLSSRHQKFNRIFSRVLSHQTESRPCEHTIHTPKNHICRHLNDDDDDCNDKIVMTKKHICQHLNDDVDMMIVTTQTIGSVLNGHPVVITRMLENRNDEGS